MRCCIRLRCGVAFAPPSSQSYEITPEFQRVAFKALNLHKYYRLTNAGSQVHNLLQTLAKQQWFTLFRTYGCVSEC